MPVINARAMRRVTSLVLMGSALAGCASSVAERGWTNVSEIAEPVLGSKPVWIRTDEEAAEARRIVTGLLARPIDVDAAVRIALLNNRSLQVAYADLGIAAADLAQASRLPNPGFSYARLSRPGELEIEREISLNLLNLLVMPVVQGIEDRRFRQGQLAAAESLLRTAAGVRHAWVRAVASQQAADYVGQAKEAAEARAEMARRLNRAGNLSSLANAREQVFYAETAAQLARARREATVARERLVRLLGVWGEDAAFALPARLPELPATPREAGDLERRAIEDRLDLRIARLDIEGLARSLGLTRATRFVNVLEAGYLRNRESGKPLQDGYEIRLEIPIFDWGDAKVARAEFAYMGAVNRLAALAVGARSEVREAYLDYRIAFDLARQYRAEILPVRQHISDEMLLRYNGMLVSIFELLADVRDQIAAVGAALEAERDFWIADATLAYATVVGAGPAAASSSIALPGAQRAGGH